MGPRDLTMVQHHFDASAEVVFDAWFDIEMLASLLLDRGNGRTDPVLLDGNLSIGGGFRFEVLSDQGKITVLGEYLAFERPRFLQMTWMLDGYGRSNLVTIDIQKLESGCILYLACEPGNTPRKAGRSLTSRPRRPCGAVAPRGALTVFDRDGRLVAGKGPGQTT